MPGVGRLDRIESEPVVEEGDLDVKKMSTPQLLALAREGRRQRLGADGLAPPDDGASESPAFCH